ncbi:MAG TPA: type II toxin-antitoxin system VapC family toxin [Verrucomicrobiae bacterium]|jgi:predicted nucleic acid-binding protein
MGALIYVETSIPSFYFEMRTNPEVLIRRQWTREWWDSPNADQRLVTSFIVIQELEEIPGNKKSDALGLIRPLRLLEYNDEVADIVRVYLEHKLMPREAMGDADHLALASYHKCDMLVTWNCRHLANANKLGHVRRVNALLGLETPLLVTPLELLGKDADES